MRLEQVPIVRVALCRLRNEIPSQAVCTVSVDIEKNVESKCKAIVSA